MDRSSLESLLHRAQGRDADALGALVEAYSPRVFGLLYRLTGSRDTAEDLMQETFLRLVRAIDEYVHGGKFEAYLFRIAANLARDHARQRKRRGRMTSLDGSGETDDGGYDFPALAQAPPHDRLLQSEGREELERALGRLPDADREILLLRHYSELAFREIADLLGVPLGTALARAHRALKRLRGELEGTGACDE